MSDGRTVWAIVPVKRFDLAKGRLADSLHADERRRLARAMLEDVLEEAVDEDEEELLEDVEVCCLLLMVFLFLSFFLIFFLLSVCAPAPGP